MKHFDYVCRLVLCGLTPPRASCSTACWTAAADWTEWRKSCKQPFSFAQLPSAERLLAVTSPRTSGTPQRSAIATLLFATSTRLRENVLLLRTSKFLMCDELRERLTATPVSAMRRWIGYGCFIGVCKKSGKTFTYSSRLANLNSCWTGDRDDEHTSER